MKKFHALFASVILSLALALPAAAASGDLAISSGSVSLSNASPLEGGAVRIWVDVANNSGYDLLGSVRFLSNGGAIADDQPVSALANSSDAVFIDWYPAYYGTHELTITVIPWDASQDDPSNNTVVQTVSVGQDTDYDGVGNDEDLDDDGDGVNDDQDEFPLNKDEWEDTDGDGTGDNADADDDNDGTLDEDDELPKDPNYTQDADGDGTADEVDEDVDGDGIPNKDEKETDPNNPDSDGDGVLDGEDAFPMDAGESSDMDGDGTGDNSDDDIDGDGIRNTEDNAPNDKKPLAQTVKGSYLAGINSEITLDASASTDDDGLIEKYEWVFQNGEVEEGRKVKVAFSDPGVYLASLTVTDDAGQSDTTEVKIRVVNMQFMLFSGLLILLLISLAFALINRYTRRAPEAKPVKKAEKSTSKAAPKKRKTTKKTSKKRISKKK